MLGLLNAFLTVQALHVAAVLGIADLLAGGPATVDELASSTGAHAPSLQRLLRTLTGVGVFREDPDGRIAVTALGETLRDDVPESVRDWALFIGNPAPWAAWGRLYDAVMTGTSGFEAAHGMGNYEYLAAHSDLAAPFDRWMTRQSDQHNAAIVSAFDFSPWRTVADIGGGQGSTLAAILTANRSLQGVLMDLPQVVSDPAPLRSAGVTARCEVIGGDLLAGVPAGADIYLIKRVLMIWDDDRAVQALSHCARVLPADGRVLVVEMVMPTGNDPTPAKSFDLLMLLANPGGRVRTEAEFGALFTAAGLRLNRVIATSSPNSILEGVPH
jgi:SAM-dependent methyltransferase